jgi:hypothetical protein
MKKRHFLAAAAVGGASLAAPAAPVRRPRRGPGLLTVSGAIGRGNRGPLDKALDQMLSKQQITFDKAHVFDFDALTAMPAVTIRPTLEYDAKVHALKGPLLTQVLQAAGVDTKAPLTLVMRAVDGYTVTLDLARARRQRFIVATHLDGRPMALGGLGPLWAVYDADRDPQAVAQPLPARFDACPWGLYHLEVRTV